MDNVTKEIEERDELQKQLREQERVAACQRHAYREEMENLAEYYFNADHRRSLAEKFIADKGLKDEYKVWVDDKELPF